MFGTSGLFEMLLTGFIIVMGILALLMPIFVLHIRASSLRIEKWLAYISSQLPDPKE